MSDFYATVEQAIRGGTRVAVATIIAIRGSVPREVGTKMLIHPQGRHVGTIGGGCGEGDVINAGLRALDDGQPALVHVDLTEDISMESLGVCGGIMDVFVEPWGNEMLPLLARLAEAISTQTPVALLTAIGTVAPDDRRLLLYGDGTREGRLGSDEGEIVRQAAELLVVGRSGLVRAGALPVYVESQARPPHLIIVGAGHIAAPLARLGRLLDFRVTVIDDRPAFANRARFPDADALIVDYFRPALAALPLDRQSYVVLVTRGHQHDVDSLLTILDRSTAYIGMIGSARRVRAVFELLEREQGIDPVRLDRVHSPIGLDIGAETPTEIAVAIMAEIIKVRRGGTGISLTDRERRGPVHSQRHAKHAG